MTPYLSRLHPAARGPRLRPRPRSTFEPSPLLPIDGPPIGRPGASVPRTWAATPAAIELEEETSHPHPASSAVAAAIPDEPESPPGPTAATAPATRDEQSPSKPAATVAEAPVETSPPASINHQTTPHSGSESFPQLPADGAPSGGLGPAPWSIRRRPSPPPARVSADEPPLPCDRLIPHVEPAPPVSPPLKPLPPAPQYSSATVPPPAPAVGPLAPHRQSERPGQLAAAPAMGPANTEPAIANPPSGLAARHVHAMAQLLREPDTSVARTGETTKPPNNTQPAAAPPVRVPSQPSTHTELTVTIGRIEVKATASDPTPQQPPSGRPQRQPPSLDDYLAARVRARGRTG
jgi:hypothetical protein